MRKQTASRNKSQKVSAADPGQQGWLVAADGEEARDIAGCPERRRGHSSSGVGGHFRLELATDEIQA